MDPQKHNIISIRGEMGWCEDCEEWHDLEDIENETLDVNTDSKEHDHEDMYDDGNDNNQELES